MNERKAQAKLISGDGLVKYIDAEYPLRPVIYTAIVRPMTGTWLSDEFPASNVTFCTQREYELYEVKEFKDFTLGVYRERL